MLNVRGSEETLKLVMEPSGAHNEPFWNSEFRESVEWLFVAVSGVDEEQGIYFVLISNGSSYWTKKVLLE